MRDKHRFYDELSLPNFGSTHEKVDLCPRPWILSELHLSNTVIIQVYMLCRDEETPPTSNSGTAARSTSHVILHSGTYYNPSAPARLSVYKFSLHYPHKMSCLVMIIQSNFQVCYDPLDSSVAV